MQNYCLKLMLSIAPMLNKKIPFVRNSWVTKLVCPVSVVLSNLNDNENDDYNTALIGGITGGVGGVLLLVIFGIVYMKRFRSNK